MGTVTIKDFWELLFIMPHLATDLGIVLADCVIIIYVALVVRMKLTQLSYASVMICILIFTTMLRRCFSVVSTLVFFQYGWFEKLSFFISISIAIYFIFKIPSLKHIKRPEDIYKDNAALKAEEQNLKNSLSHLESALHGLEEFSFMVSHDLRAPIRAANGFAKIVREDYSDNLDDRGKDYLNRIVDSCDRMFVVIDDLMKLSRLDSKPVTLVEVDLTQECEKVVQAIREMDSGNRIVKVTVEQGMRLKADKNLLRIALENIIGNAWKYSLNRATPSIDIYREGRAIAIRDNGIGFDMKHYDRLFEPFQRLPSAGGFPGSGLGLVIVCRIMKRHNGKIWAKSQLGEGATFYFYI